MAKNSNQIYEYMVEFQVPALLTDEMLGLIPEQQDQVAKLFVKGKLKTYTLSADRTKLWAVFSISSESELIASIDSLPMSYLMDYNYYELMFHNTVSLIPAMSLN